MHFLTCIYCTPTWTQLEKANPKKKKTKIKSKRKSKSNIEYGKSKLKKIEIYLQDKYIYIYILEFIKLVTSCDEGIQAHQQLYGELLSQ